MCTSQNHWVGDSSIARASLRWGGSWLGGTCPWSSATARCCGRCWRGLGVIRISSKQLPVLFYETASSLAWRIRRNCTEQTCWPTRRPPGWRRRGATGFAARNGRSTGPLVPSGSCCWPGRIQPRMCAISRCFFSKRPDLRWANIFISREPRRMDCAVAISAASDSGTACCLGMP